MDEGRGDPVQNQILWVLIQFDLQVFFPLAFNKELRGAIKSSTYLTVSD